MDWTVWGLGRLDWLFFASALNIIHTPAEESLLKEISRQVCGDPAGALQPAPPGLGSKSVYCKIYVK